MQPILGLLVFALVGLLLYGFVRLFMDIFGKKKGGGESVNPNELWNLKKRMERLEENLEQLKVRLSGGPVAPLSPFEQGRTKVKEELAPVETKIQAEKVKTVFVRSDPYAGPSKEETKAEPVIEEKDKESLEMKVGGKWFLWIGIVIVLFAAGFFMKFAFDNGWVTETMRVINGILTGFGLLVAGKFMHKKYPLYSQGITGAGIALFYISLYTAGPLYNLISLETAFVFMILVTLVGAALALLYDSLIVAVLSLLGGFLTPILLSTGVDKQVSFLTYIACLDAGILLLAYFKKWDILKYMSFLGTIVMFFGWGDKYYTQDKLMMTSVFLSVFFLIFTLQSFVQNVIKGWQVSRGDLSMIFLNTFTFYGVFYGLVMQKYPGWEQSGLLSFVAIALAIYFYLQSYLALKKNKENKYILYVLMGVAITFITVAIIVALKQCWITVGWAVEALILSAIGFKTKNKTTRTAGIIVFIFVGLRLAIWDMDLPLKDFELVWNNRFFAYIIAIACSLGTAVMYYSRQDIIEEGEKKTGDVITALSLMAAFALLTIEVLDFNGARGAIGMQFQTGAYLSIFWTLFAVLLFVAGIKFKNKPARGLGLIALVLSMFVVVLPLNLFMPLNKYMFIENLRTLAFVICLAAVILVMYLLWKKKDEVTSEEAALLGVFGVIANIMTICYLSAEAVNYYDLKYRLELNNDYKALGQVKGAALSVTWALYSILLMVISIFKKFKGGRLLAMVIFSITILKVFIVDLSYLETIYRIISFFGLGVLLMLAAFLYTKYKDKIREFAVEDK